MLPSMTEILSEYWVGGLLTKSTSGNGVPLYGCNFKIPDFSNTECDCFPFIGSGNDQRLKFLDPRSRLILNEYIDASSP